MENGKDDHFLVTDFVVDAKWESVEDCLADVIYNQRIKVRVLGDSIQVFRNGV